MKQLSQQTCTQLYSNQPHLQLYLLLISTTAKQHATPLKTGHFSYLLSLYFYLPTLTLYILKVYWVSDKLQNILLRSSCNQSKNKL